MRGMFAALVLMLAAAGLQAQVFDLHKYGKLEIYPVGEWNFRSEDVGDLKILLTPKDSLVNAAGQIIVAAGGPDEYPTREKLARQIEGAGRRMIDAGDFAERDIELKTLYSKQGFGYYFTLTDPKLAGKPAVAGDYKKITLGMIRVSSSVMIRIQIMSDSELSEEFQQLLGMVEGMELSAK
jgi:hypothetical protein